jgi:hypothetical protein
MAQATAMVCTVVRPQQNARGLHGTQLHQLRPQRSQLVGRSQFREKARGRTSLSVTNIFSWIPSPLPEPIKFPRARLNQRFAVLLLNSVRTLNKFAVARKSFSGVDTKLARHHTNCCFLFSCDTNIICGRLRTAEIVLCDRVAPDI